MLHDPNLSAYTKRRKHRWSVRRRIDALNTFSRRFSLGAIGLGLALIVFNLARWVGQ